MKKILLTIILIFGLCSISFGADEWLKGIYTDDELIPNAPGLLRVNNEAIDRVLSTLQKSADVIYSSTTEVTISAGSIVCSNSGGTVRKFRTNTSTTTVGWGNIDIGAEEASNTYNVFGVCDADATTFTVVISKSAAPSGSTYFKKLGSFFNNSGSDIDRRKVYANAYHHSPTDSSGIPKITAIYDYGSSTSSFTSKTSDLKIAFGAGTDPFTITNLPFTTASSYRVSCNHAVAATQSQQVAILSKSASSFTCSDGLANGKSIEWIAVGH